MKRFLTLATTAALVLGSTNAHVLHHENILQTGCHKRNHHKMETHYGCVQDPFLGI